MTIEDRCRAVQFEADLVPDRLGSLPSVVSRGSGGAPLQGRDGHAHAGRCRISVVAGELVRSAPRGGDVPPASESSADFIGAVELGGVDLPVTGVIALTAPAAPSTQAVHDEPRFDTGARLRSCHSSAPTAPPHPPRSPGEVVYVGTVSDRSIYLYEAPWLTVPRSALVAHGGHRQVQESWGQLTEKRREGTGARTRSDSSDAAYRGAPAVWHDR